jgi:hypothetical protein
MGGKQSEATGLYTRHGRHHGPDAHEGSSTREVEENPKLFLFDIVNFNLLVAILNQLPPENRSAFVTGLVKMLLVWAPTNETGAQKKFPLWDSKTSSLALLAEFCIRNGYPQALLDGTLELTLPTAGIAIMLIEIEEILSLNFNLFSRAEIDNLPKTLAHMREIADQNMVLPDPGWTTEGG